MRRIQHALIIACALVGGDACNAAPTTSCTKGSAGCPCDDAKCSSGRCISGLCVDLEGDSDIDGDTTITGGASTSSGDTSATTSTTSTGVTSSSSETSLPPPADAGTPLFLCDLFMSDCVGTQDYCVPFDPSDEGLWTGSHCVSLPGEPAGVGSPCSMPDGPLDGQAGCGPALVCFTAEPTATEGSCAATCSVANPECEDGMDCLACLGTGIEPWGVCVTTAGCPDGLCTVVGCH